MKIRTALAAMLVLSSVSAFAEGSKESSKPAGPAAAPYTIEVSGSTSVTPMMEALAAKYKAVAPHVTININGTGSSDGIKAANQGTSELGMSSRELKTAEKGFGLSELVIAMDGIAAIVNKDNPVADLSLDQLRAIYTGEVTDWSQVGGKAGKIAVVSREPGSGTRGAFEEIVKFQDKLVKGATEFDGTGAVKAEVSKNVDAIGYISLGSVDASVKPVKIGGVEASSANVLNGTFKIARPFLVLSRAEKVNAETKKFLDWVMSADGQAVAATHWIPVK